MAGSKPGTLDRSDIEKIGKGAMIALAGAVLTYGTDILAMTVTEQSLGQFYPVVMAVWSVIVNAARKWIANNRTIYNMKN